MPEAARRTGRVPRVKSKRGTATMVQVPALRVTVNELSP